MRVSPRVRGVTVLTSGAAAVLVTSVLLAGCASAHHSGEASTSAAAGSYGSLPTFLPSSTLQPDSVLTGSPARPALTSEGDGVEVEVSGAWVLVTVAGPTVPGEGLPYQSADTTCTWTVTMSVPDGTRAPVRVALADFSATDHFGARYGLSPVGRTGVPTQLRPGSSQSFQVRTVMPVGEGLMRWAPDGHDVEAEWDFEVEND